MAGKFIASNRGVLRRLTAVLGMIAILGLLCVLLWEVQHHRRRPFATQPTTIVELEPLTSQIFQAAQQ